MELSVSTLLQKQLQDVLTELAKEDEYLTSSVTPTTLFIIADAFQSSDELLNLVNLEKINRC